MAEARFVEMPIQNQMPIYTGRSGQPVIDVQTDGETVWLTQAQLVRLFDSSKANISKHIKNIFVEGELDAEAVVRKFQTVQTEGNREISRDAETEYKKYQVKILLPVESAYLDSVKTTVKKMDRLRADIEGGVV